MKPSIALRPLRSPTLGLCAAALLGMVALDGAQAAIVTYSSRAAFDAVSGSTALQDFDAVPVGTSFLNTSFSLGDFSVARPGSLLGYGQFDSGAGAFNVNGTTYGLANDMIGGGFDAELIFTFATPITAFGLDAFALNDVAVDGNKPRTFVQADGMSVPLSTQVGQNKRFFGFTSDVPFTTVHFIGTGQNDNWGFDNLAYSHSAGTSVPEPDSLALAGLALAALAASRRRRPARPLLALGLGLSLLGPLAAHAAPVAELRGYIVGGAAFSPGFYFNQSVSPASAGSTIVKSISDNGIDGSYADGRVDVGFGSLHSYSDAHEVALGGGAPQSHASSEFIDYIKPWASSPIGYTAYTLTLAIGGSHSPTNPFGPRPGYTALGSIFYDVRDDRTGDVFAHGFFNSSDAVPSTTLLISILIPPGEATDDMRIDVGLDTYAYVSNIDPAYQTAFADYSHTLVTHLDALTDGASTLGVSGFDHATPAPTGVPEPASALLLATVITALATIRRRKPISGARS
ncbi:MAG: PEP-CTERM sorting domain-containing protein [Burkholderiales bacterium]|nr:PEP-CTERM sorting domain-containing protein [Burkholderiales bacterium]